MTPYPLGRVVDHDPRSLAYPAQADLPVRTRSWRRYGAVLDQGQVGSCTGNAGVHALNHTPFHVVGTRCGVESDALILYSAATVADPFPGTYPPDDTGSSGLAVAQVLKLGGRIGSYTHAFGFDHLLSALMVSPLIVGTNWYEGMFSPGTNGLVYPTGGIAGGHEYVINGVHVTDQILRFQNSWGKGWGIGGHFYMGWNDFATLLSNDGDAIQFTI